MTPIGKAKMATFLAVFYAACLAIAWDAIGVWRERGPMATMDFGKPPQPAWAVLLTAAAFPAVATIALFVVGVARRRSRP